MFPNNSPLKERDYRTPERAREFYKRAIGATPQEQETLLQQGFGALRSSYEALIIFDLFKEVVMRFDERVSFGRMRDITWDYALVQDVISKCETLSRYIEGHLHSNAFMSKKPTPDLLCKEIQDFESIKNRLKQLKKPKAQRVN